jgi:hypothetical protein
MAEAQQSWRANRITSFVRAVGGRLSVEDGRLVFQPNAIDRSLRAGEWSVALSEIAAVDVAPRRPASHLFGAGLRRQLRIRAHGEETHFIVNGVDDVAAALRDAVDGAR